MKVIIAGAGIGGLSAALALARKGASVTICDSASVLKEAGAGLQLSANACKALFSLGLEQQVRAIGFYPVAAEVRRASDEALMLYNPLGAEAEDKYGAPYLQVHRSDLQGVLLDACLSTKNITLRLGARAVWARTEEGEAVLDLESGEVLAGDIVIGADGVRSRIREALFGPESPVFTGQVAWRGVVEASRLPGGLIPPKAMVWTGGERHFVHYYVSGGRLVNFIGVVERDWRKEGWTEPGAPSELFADFEGWPEPVEALCRAVEAPFRWALFGRPSYRRWSVGRITLLGDACHPMLPFLAQGAAMAIEDAVVLADRLHRLVDPVLALKAYEAARITRTAKVQAWSRRNAKLFHLPSPAAGLVFGAAKLVDGLRGHEPGDRLDWLYGYEAK
jgi:salicylate hydroxylase